MYVFVSIFMVHYGEIRLNWLLKHSLLLYLLYLIT